MFVVQRCRHIILTDVDLAIYIRGSDRNVLLRREHVLKAIVLRVGHNLVPKLRPIRFGLNTGIDIFI